MASKNSLTIGFLIGWLTFTKIWPYYYRRMIPKQCKDSKFRLVTLSSNCVWLVIYSPLSGLQITDLRHTANSQSVLIKLNLKVTPPHISHLKWYDNDSSNHSTNVVVMFWNLQCSKTESSKSCELDDDQIWADIQLPLLISCFIPGYPQKVRSLNTSYHRPTCAARIKSPPIRTLFITLQYPDLTWTRTIDRL